MPLDSYQRETVARRALALIGAHPDWTDQRVLQEINQGAYASRDNSVLTTMFNTIRSERRLGEVGKALDEGNAQNTPFRGTITDWALGVGGGRYTWRVEVVATNNATGEEVRWLVPLWFDSPVSPAEARQAAIEATQRDGTIGGEYPTRGSVNEQFVVETRIVTAGKSPT